MKRSLTSFLQTAIAVITFSVATLAGAGAQIVENTTISAVAVNGGIDTANPGTTCIRVASPVPAACTAGYVAIPNNNRHLVATALMSKASSSRVSVYLVDDHGSNHCPGRVFTPCSVISIESN